MKRFGFCIHTLATTGPERGWHYVAISRRLFCHVLHIGLPVKLGDESTHTVVAHRQGTAGDG